MDSNVQVQCLDLIRGIKNATEKQNELLERLVTLMTDSTVRQPYGEEKRFGRNTSPLNVSAQYVRVQVDEAIVSGEGSDDNLGTAAQQDENLMNIIHFAPDSYKKRLQLFSIENNDPRIRSQSHLVQYYNVDAAVNATASWKYWYPSDWRTKYGQNNMISPVPGFILWWQLVYMQDKSWYHVDDTEGEYPIRHAYNPATNVSESLEIPYSYIPMMAQVDHTALGPYIYDIGGRGLTKRQRQNIQQSLGDIFAVPEDGRLPLAFHTSELRQLNQYCSASDHSSRMLHDYLASANKLLDKLYRFTIIDITAPGGSVNAIYDGHRSFGSSQANRPSSDVEIPAYWAMVHPALQRESDGFVAYPSVTKDLNNGKLYQLGQWCRVIQLSGLAEIAAGLAEDPSPSLEAKTNVRRAAEDWSSVQVALSPIIDHDPLFLDPNQHDNLLSDDDTFSRSRRYFWVVSCLESFQAVIDDAIEEWEKFRAEWPNMMMGIDPAEESSTTETSQEMTRRVLDEIETQVDRLRDISARFESSRDKTKVLREGASNP
ncbi:hypothetical protein ACHAPI_011029 [Fusarium lateritium]